MKTLRNLNLYLNKFDLILFFYFSFLFILPPLLGDSTRNNQYYHFFNIIIASIIFFWGFFFKKKNYHLTVLLFFGFIFLITITSNYFHSDSLIFFYYFFVMFFSSLIIIENFSLEKLIKIYCTICFFLSIYAVYEFFNPFERFEIGTQLEPRANSIFREPSHFAITVLPSLAYYFGNFKKKILQILVISISLIITYSITVYFLLFSLISIYSLYFFKKYNKNLFNFFSLIVLITIIIFLNLDLSKFTNRYALNLFEFFDIDSINRNKNLTLWSVITSIKVNLFTLIYHPSGVGLGNFSLAYYKVISNFIYDYNFFYGPVEDIYAEDSIFWFAKTVGFNENGHSLIFRLVSELGIISLLFPLLLLFNLLTIFSERKELFAFNLCILLFLLGKFFKVSSYFLYGTPIFLVLFFYLNIKSLIEMKINKNYLYLPLLFFAVFSVTFFISKKVNNEKVYNLKLYSSLSASEYLFSIDKSIKNNFDGLNEPIFLDIDYEGNKAILNIKYISDNEIDKNKIKKFINNEFENFRNKRKYNITPSLRISKEFYRTELYNTSHPFWSDLNPSFFIKNDFGFEDEGKILSADELKRYKNKFKKKAGINDLNFIDNLNNNFGENQPKGNLKAKKYKLIENLLKSQSLFLVQNKHPSAILSIIINYYCNPNFKTKYYDRDNFPVLYRVIINRSNFPIKFNMYLVSVFISILSCIIFLNFKKIKK